MAATMHDPGNFVSSCLWDVSVSVLLLLQQGPPTELRSHRFPNLNLSHSVCVYVCVCAGHINCMEWKKRLCTRIRGKEIQGIRLEGSKKKKVSMSSAWVCYEL